MAAPTIRVLGRGTVSYGPSGVTSTLTASLDVSTPTTAGNSIVAQITFVHPPSGSPPKFITALIVPSNLEFTLDYITPTTSPGDVGFAYLSLHNCPSFPDRFPVHQINTYFYMWPSSDTSNINNQLTQIAAEAVIYEVGFGGVPGGFSGATYHIDTTGATAPNSGALPSVAGSPEIFIGAAVVSSSSGTASTGLDQPPWTVPITTSIVVGNATGAPPVVIGISGWQTTGAALGSVTASGSISGTGALQSAAIVAGYIPVTMAYGFGLGFAGTASGASSLTTTLSNYTYLSTRQDDDIVVAITYRASFAFGTLTFSATDSAGNTYVQDYATPSPATGRTGQVFLRAAKAAPLNSGSSTITVTASPFAPTLWGFVGFSMRFPSFGVTLEETGFFTSVNHDASYTVNLSTPVVSSSQVIVCSAYILNMANVSLQIKDSTFVNNGALGTFTSSSSNPTFPEIQSEVFFKRILSNASGTYPVLFGVFNQGNSLEESGVMLAYTPRHTVINQIGHADIAGRSFLPQIGTSRVKTSNATFAQGISRIRLVDLLPQVGHAIIGKGVFTPQLGIGRVKVSTILSQFGHTSVRGSAAITATGIARVNIQVIPSHIEQTGIIRIQANSNAQQFGISRVTGNAIATRIGIARVYILGDARQTGISRILTSTALSVTGRAKTTIRGSGVLSAISRIVAPIKAIQRGVARIVRAEILSPITAVFYNGPMLNTGFVMSSESTMPDFIPTFLDVNNNIINFPVGCTSKFSMRLQGNGYIVRNKTASMVTQLDANGNPYNTPIYSWADGDTYYPGTYNWEFVVSFPDGRTLRCPVDPTSATGTLTILPSYTPDP